MIRHALLPLFVCVLAASAAAEAQESNGNTRKDPQPIVLTVDVAEDLAGKFVPTLVRPEHVQPERGSFYITEGRVFPAGTIQGDGATFDPNQIGHIGVWISRGTHLVSASEIPAAGWWASTAQLFVLGRQAREQISSEGVEGRGTLTRVVTGGTGNFAGVRGEQQVTVLGVNATGGVNLRVTFTLYPAN